MDAGIVSQNISIFCSAAKLATVPRASMDAAHLKKVLKLKDSQIPMMNHPVDTLNDLYSAYKNGDTIHTG